MSAQSNGGPVSLPQIAAMADLTPARMHQLFQLGRIPFPRVDSGKQPRYEDTPELRKWANNLRANRGVKIKPHSALTLRAYIATAALSNMKIFGDDCYGESDRITKLPEKHAKWAATAAVRYADALIAELIAELNKEKAK